MRGADIAIVESGSYSWGLIPIRRAPAVPGAPVCASARSGRAGPDRAALDERDAGAAHLRDRALAVAGLQLDGATAVLDQLHVEAEVAGVERRRLHAVIGREAHHVDLLDPARAQPLGEPGRLLVVVVEEARVAVDRWIGALLDHFCNSRPIELHAELD